RSYWNSLVCRLGFCSLLGSSTPSIITCDNRRYSPSNITLTKNDLTSSCPKLWPKNNFIEPGLGFVFGDLQNVQAVVGASISDPNYAKLHQYLKSRNISYVLYFLDASQNPPSQKTDLNLPGYGVELALKNTEYNARNIDDEDDS